MRFGPGSTPAPGTITNAMLATMAARTMKGNASGLAAVPSDLTAEQVIGLLSVVTTSDPTLSSDSSAGHFVGQRWLNTSSGRTWVCAAATVGAARWIRTGGPCQTMQADAGTLGLWRFEGNGNDSSGNGYNLTASGGTTPFYTGAIGGRLYVGTAGVSNFDVSNAALMLTGSMALTMVTRFEPYNPATQVVIRAGSDAARFFDIFLDTATSRTSFNWGFWNGSAHVHTLQNVMPNHWNVVHCTRVVSGGSTTLAVYANGLLVGSQTFAAQVPSGSGTILNVAGAITAGSTVQNGAYAGLRLSTTVPSAAQIAHEAQLYTPFVGIAA